MKIALVIAKREECIKELTKWLDKVDADMYVFPEAFIRSEDELNIASKIIVDKMKSVVLGYTEHYSTYSYETALYYERGNYIGKHIKTSLTKNEKEKGRRSGNKISCISSNEFTLAVPICYEIHFPEIVRIMNLDKPGLIVNIIGTGMHDEHQLMEWLSIARVRAIENETVVIGCSNFKGDIPIAFAFSPLGDMIGFKRDVNDALTLSIELNHKKKYNYMEDRIPSLYTRLSD